MLLKKVFIRFYKSFNDDFLRKNDDRVKPKPWELIKDAFYPYIEVPIEPKITTIVGANESGKSHLLSAIEKALFVKDTEPSDFCRYSPLFTVKKNELKSPDFGSEWSGLSKSEKESIREIIKEIPEKIILDRLLIFGNHVDDLTLYLPEKGDYRPYKLEKKQVIELQKLLPRPFRIESNVALPSSVPIKKLVELDREDYSGSKKFELLDREQRNRIVKALDVFSNNPELITSIRHLSGEKREEIEHEAITSLKSIISALDEVSFSDIEKERREKEFNLAYKLICKIAQVDTNSLLNLADAIQNGMQGFANGIIDKINDQLASNLNFPNYWVQDRNFCLKVVARDYDLVFTITDRTGTEYSFDERSQGLRFFLSYYIEYRSHEPHQNKNEILLMDEPDAYLSSQAQQDLLKVFDLFANPEPGSHLTHPIQVVYVTHSPFLIDKNHTDRIRVLQKGNEDEGTRVVRDFAKNRYEPLRSSIGTLIGESVFIGNCNLMVEGICEQIIIAGAARYLRPIVESDKLETLDLNHITIVDSGGANQVPYMVYLACGRHVEQIAVIVLLDSDKCGNDAKKQLLGRGAQHRRPLIKPEFILQLGDLKQEFSLVADNATEKLEIEDIIPLSICIKATKLYLQEFLQVDETSVSFLTEELILSKIDNLTILDAIQESISESFYKELKVSKAGFARNVIQVVNEWSQKRGELDENQSKALQIFEENFKILFKKLNFMQRSAQKRLTKEMLKQKIKRLNNSFIVLHPISAKREDGVILLDEIEDVIKSNIENESPQEIEAIQNVIQNLRRHYKLDVEMNKTIDDYTEFKMGLERINNAGLLASQEETVEAQAEESNISEEVLEDTKMDKSLKDGHEQLINEQVSTTSEVETAEVSDRSANSNMRKKPNPPK
ncbi:AAA family ATPase [Microcoleus sp. Pol11C2]|uniref:AAA family ATPase n=1 Tax=Microcoleus sp. Pol11C2 TaxID=3055389 RepID=UPI002FD24491